MFLTTGEALDRSLKCGNEAFDRNLNLVRLYLFGNVMILNAPHWSDVSAQFTHGFPRRLMDSHRGILPGNITVAARISNQGIRSVSPGDVAAFMSKKNDTRFGTDRYRTDARANDSNQICGKVRQARTSRGNDGSLWSRLPDHDAPGSGTDKGAQTGQFFLLGSHDSFCSRRRGGQQFG